jgi:hypothetical protein
MGMAASPLPPASLAPAWQAQAQHSLARAQPSLWQSPAVAAAGSPIPAACLPPLFAAWGAQPPGVPPAAQAPQPPAAAAPILQSPQRSPLAEAAAARRSPLFPGSTPQSPLAAAAAAGMGRSLFFPGSTPQSPSAAAAVAAAAAEPNQRLSQMSPWGQPAATAAAEPSGVSLWPSLAASPPRSPAAAAAAVSPQAWPSLPTAVASLAAAAASPAAAATASPVAWPALPAAASPQQPRPALEAASAAVLALQLRRSEEPPPTQLLQVGAPLQLPRAALLEPTTSKHSAASASLKPTLTRYVPPCSVPLRHLQEAQRHLQCAFEMLPSSSAMSGKPLVCPGGLGCAPSGHVSCRLAHSWQLAATANS